MNCSNRGLTSVPNQIPARTSNLSLNGNVLHKIPSNAFRNLKNLVWLDLSDSQIYHLESGAFKNLSRLKFLRLRNNYLCERNGSYAEDVFTPLAHTLQWLDISGNLRNIPKKKMSYPSKSLSVLHSLKVLKLDCISGEKLGKEFKTLSSLEELDFSQGIQAEYVPDDMFQSIYGLHLKKLNLTNLNVNRISGCVFSRLVSLKNLDLSHNRRLVSNVVHVAHRLRNTSIEELYLTSTCLGINNALEGILANLNGTHVRVLALDQNEIHEVQSLFSRLPHIEILMLANNGIQATKIFDYFKDIYEAKNLKKLDFNNQKFLLQSSCKSYVSIKKSNVSTTVSKLNDFNFCDYGTSCLVVWPPKLEWLGASNIGASLPAVPNTTFWNNGSMKYLVVSNNRIEAFPNYLQCGVLSKNIISTIEYIDGSNCDIKCVSKDIAGNCTFSVKFANGSHNKIGLLEGDCNKDPKKDFLAFIKKFPTAEIFDASYNEISFLPDDPDIFEAAINIRVLIASNNKLSSLKPANLSKLVSLEYLDLSHNKFRTISSATRRMLDDLDKKLYRRKSLHLSLNFLGNPLLCTCKDLQLIEWLTITKFNFTNRDQYTCTYQDGSLVKMSDKLFYGLELECNDNNWLIVSSACLAVHYLLVTIASIWYRYRHYFRYFLLKIRMRQERLDAVLGRNEEYKYDAFISCTREGAKWIKRHFIDRFENDKLQLKFCIAQRDFLVGKTIIDNIMDTISQSRKTILLVDETFINSKWCQEELLLSHHVSTFICWLKKIVNCISSTKTR